MIITYYYNIMVSIFSWYGCHYAPTIVYCALNMFCRIIYSTSV